MFRELVVMGEIFAYTLCAPSQFFSPKGVAVGNEVKVNYFV